MLYSLIHYYTFLDFYELFWFYVFLILLTVCRRGFGITHFIQDKQEGYVGKIEDVTHLSCIRMILCSAFLVCRERPTPKSELWVAWGICKQGDLGWPLTLTGEAIKDVWPYLCWVNHMVKLTGVKERTHSSTHAHTRARSMQGANEEEPWDICMPLS